VTGMAVFPWKHQGVWMLARFDVTDVIVLVGALLTVVGIYMLAGGAWAVVFVGVILLVTGLLGAWRRAGGGTKHGSDQ